MIQFQYVSLRNFLTYGNVPTIFALNLHNNTLIIGKNGYGKSAMADAICFALFKKSYRNIPLPLLVNSKNKKECVIEVAFEIGVKAYKVIRGIKPGIFEIWENGVLIKDSDASIGDYQEYLENQILKMNYKTFCQICIVGTAAFIPFMKLSTPQRREVVEDVLDITVFSEMNRILRLRIAATDKEFSQVDQQLEIAKRDSVAQQRVIKILEDAAKTQVQDKQREIDALIDTRDDIEIELVATKMQKRPKKPEYDYSLHTKGSRDYDAIRREIEKLDKQIASINALAECPMCLQDVSDDHKHGIGEKLDTEKLSKKTIENQLADTLLLLEEQSKEYKDFEDSTRIYEQEVEKLEDMLRDYNYRIETAQQNIVALQSKESSVSDEKTKLKDIADRAMKLIGRRSELLEEKNLQEVSLTLLKDSGIKASIIKEYIPLINNYLNKYLSLFGFVVNFTLDENFNETIRSRGRDDFVYNSFSEGQKRKIDVAILFAFRQVTGKKNSANCNLLVLDELVDSSFDVESKESFIELLKYEGGNNFVISHTASPNDFDATLKVSMAGYFSQYEFIS